LKRSQWFPVVLTLILAVSLSPLRAAEPVPPVTEHWSKAYKEFNDLVGQLDVDAGKNFYRQFMIITHGNTITTIPLDLFSVRVLRETNEVLQPYRQGLQQCIEKNQNEYRTATKPASYEQFTWFLDSYTRQLLSSLNGQDQTVEGEFGIRSRRVTTDRAIYAYTKLLVAYIEERLERNQKAVGAALDQSADRALAMAINDIGRRVFHIDINQPFDRKEFLQKGMNSQPIFRDLAGVEGGTNFQMGLDPLRQLSAENTIEPACRIVIPLKGTKAVSAQ